MLTIVPVILLAVLAWYLISPPDRPNAGIASAKDPRLVAECIASAYHGVPRQVRPGIYLFEVRNGRNALQMQFLVANAPDGSLVLARYGPWFGLSNRWRACL